MIKVVKGFLALTKVPNPEGDRGRSAIYYAKGSAIQSVESFDKQLTEIYMNEYSATVRESPEEIIEAIAESYKQAKQK